MSNIRLYSKITGLYYLNLDCRPDRNQLAWKEFDRVGLYPERFSGIGENTTDYRYNRAGATFSFAEINRLAISKRHEYFIVFEDDIFFYDNAIESVNNAFVELEKQKIKWGILFLGCRPNTERTGFHPLEQYKHQKFMKVNSAKTAHAILYNKKYIVDFLDLSAKLFPDLPTTINYIFSGQDCWDALIQRELCHKDLAYVTNDIVCNQLSSYSNIDQKFSDRCEAIYNDFNHYKKIAPII